MPHARRADKRGAASMHMLQQYQPRAEGEASGVHVQGLQEGWHVMWPSGTGLGRATAHPGEVEGLGAVHAQVEAVGQLLGPPRACQPVLGQVLGPVVPEQHLAAGLERAGHAVHGLRQVTECQLAQEVPDHLGLNMSIVEQELAAWPGQPGHAVDGLCRFG